MQNFLSITDLTPSELQNVLDRATSIKTGKQSETLSGKTAVLLFDKPSLRTKLSFDMAVNRLGGRTVYFSPDEVGMDIREPVEDVSKVVSRMADLVIVRTFKHADLERFANVSSIPVINALTDKEHPCQALADLLTIREFHGSNRGARVAFIGDGNNVVSSLALALAATGNHLVIASPNGYELAPDIRNEAERLAYENNASISLVVNPIDAVSGSDFIYTDTWVSMGQEIESEQRHKDFEGYRVDTELLTKASSHVRLMHDLPAHHGIEIEEGLIYGNRSIVFDQAENRIYAQSALLDFLVRSD